jgi:hypothetical protein
MKIILLTSIIIMGCGVTAHRDDFQIVSTKPIEDRFVALSDTLVEGKAFFGAVSIVTGLPLPDNVIERSIADVISKHEGATYLINLSFIDKGYCIYTKGIPAKIK